MVNPVIILAGGFGSRLQSVVNDRPKAMADINGRPFLQYLLDFLILEGINHCILAVGYKWESIKDYFGDSYRSLKITYSIEESPLGTGGAIIKAMKTVEDDTFYVFNGDTFFAIDLTLFYLSHKQREKQLTIALKAMNNFDRYGAVLTDEEGTVTAFEEKQFKKSGNINGGIYLLNNSLFDGLPLPEKFSFETEFLSKYYKDIPFNGLVFNDYFIDIGIPEDYERAKHELERFTN